MGGIGDWLASAWGATKNAVTRAVTTVKAAVQYVGEKAKEGANAVFTAASNAATAVHDDVKGVVNFAGQQIDKLTTAGANLTSGLGSAISSPFTWIALAVGGLVVLPLVSKVV